MINLQELITRARYLFANAPQRLEAFQLINGRKSAKEIAATTGRGLISVANDLRKMRDMGLIEPKKDKSGNVIKKEGSVVYRKTPLISQVRPSYFKGPVKNRTLVEKAISKKHAKRLPSKLPLPTATEILDICKGGEDQLYEFKAPGVKMDKISREIAAFLHTRKGGIVFYGIADNGDILGSDLTRQTFDQKIHNAVRNTIKPAPTIDVKEREVLGKKVISIIIPPWDRDALYEFEGKYMIRKGGNAFKATPEEVRMLGRRKYIT